MIYMKITKIGHCCLQIDVGDVRILTDPGNLSVTQDSIRDIDAVIITHEHADHCHVPSVEQIIANNPQLSVYANESTAAFLEDAGIACARIAEGAVLDISGVSVQTWNCEHADIYDDVTPVLNTALLINNTLLYPGDAYFDPQQQVDTLAVPIEGPWGKNSRSDRVCYRA